MKYLGIDFGTKRIGIALSDEGGTFAFPKGILEQNGAIGKIVNVCLEEGVQGVVIGESLASNEQENDLVHAANAFAERLRTEAKIPIYFEREDFSSVEAHRYQIKAGARDDSAAAIILQRFLDKKKKRA